MSEEYEQRLDAGNQGFVPEAEPEMVVENKSSSGLIRAGLFGVVLFLAVIGFASVINNWFRQPSTPEIQRIAEHVEAAEKSGASEFQKLERVWVETRALLETQFDIKRRQMAAVTKVEADIVLAEKRIVQAENAVTVAMEAHERAKAHLDDTKAALKILETDTPEEAFEDAQLALNEARESVKIAKAQFDLAKAEQRRIQATVAELRRAAAAAEAAASASRLVVSAAAAAQQAVSDNQDVIADADSQALSNLETDFFAEARQQAESVEKSSKAAQQAVDASEVRLGILKRQETDLRKTLNQAAAMEKEALEQLKSVEKRVTAHLQKMHLVEKEKGLAETQVLAAERNAEEKRLALKKRRDVVATLHAALDTARSDADKAENTLEIVRNTFQETEAQLKSLHRERTEKIAVSMAAANSKLNEKLRKVISGSAPDHPIFDRLVFSSAKLFEPGSAVLNDSGKELLLKVVPTLNEVVGELDGDVNWVLRVDGHTDNTPLRGTGKFKDNWELSQARALSVVRFLVKTSSLPPKHLSANGYGEYQPLTEGSSEAAMAKNRRIELTLAAR